MNLSDLVHQSGQEHLTSQHSYPSPAKQTSPRLSNGYQQTSSEDMASLSALKPTSYPSQAAFARSPRPPPSPPVDPPNQTTLPSIHNLIGMADASSARNGSGELEVHQPQAQHPSLKDPSDSRVYGAYGHPSVSNPRALPPTPPMRPNSGFDGPHQSPSVSSPRSSASISQYNGEAINNIEPHQQRQPQPASIGSYSIPPRHPSQSPFNTSPYGSPGTMSSYSYPSPVPHPSVTSTGMYYQRPLPPPDLPLVRPLGLSTPINISPIDHTNPWQQHQHHHYISPSASAAFANQQTDRYICQTCNKAFSRPSSLRIHSHSHTGEKPFKCPHIGCGKAFSVRSNMKRHERGCHGSGSPGGL